MEVTFRSFVLSQSLTVAAVAAVASYFAWYCFAVMKFR